MKKFSCINDYMASVPEPKAVDYTSLLESLTIEMDGEAEPWHRDVKIKVSQEFLDKLKDMMNLMFAEEKKSILEKAKISVYTKDASWVDGELQALYESWKK
jgi:hypothetical protein